MKLNKLIRIGDALELISNETDTHDIPSIILALTGLCWDKEDAGELAEYHRDEEEQDDDRQTD